MFTELDGDQIRIQTNAAQTFEAWREADQTFRHSYSGRMNWSGARNNHYLYRIDGSGTVRRSLGPRSPATEKLKDEYTAQRRRLRERRSRLAKKLKQEAPINRAYRLGRVPNIAASVMRAIDEEGLLGGPLLVVGTHSLYAYEAAAGLHLDASLIATTDIDLLLDARRRLKIAVLEGEEATVLSVLRRVDKTFQKQANTYRAANDDGYLVDVIKPFDEDALRAQPDPGPENDLEAVGIMGLQWLINAPRFEQVAIAADGRPVRIACVDPRAFALHKYWVSTEAEGRKPGQRRRDMQQAKAAAVIARDYLDLPFNAKSLSALPLRMLQYAKKLASLK